MAAEIDGARRRRIAFAALTAAAVGPLAYLLQRLADHAMGPEMDPFAMLSTTTVTYYWRCAVAVFWAGLAAIAASFVAPRVPVERAVVPVAIATAALAAAFVGLSWLYP